MDDNKKLIYICYALVSEDKNSTLKMQGPYIHSKPEQCGYNNKEELFIFEDSDFKKERKFLSKFLREKHPDKLSIFHKVMVDSVSGLSLTCSNCSTKVTLPRGFNDSTWVCPTCNAINEIKNFLELNLEIRQRGMMKAQEYFDRRFDQMNENYSICNRTKRKKK